MSLDAMKQALEVLSLELPIGSHIELKNALRAAIEQAQPDELMVWKSRAMSAERIIEKFMQPEQEPVAWMYVNTDGECEQIEYIENDPMPDDPSVTPLYTAPRPWQGLTDAEIKAPIQRAMQHFGYDPTQYSLGGAATIGFLGLVREIEAKLREKNNG